MNAQLLTDQFLPELSAWVAEVPSGLLFTGLGQTIIGLVLGVAFLGLAAAVQMDPRDLALATGLSAHFLAHPNAPGLYGIFSPAPAGSSSIMSGAQVLKAAAATGSWDLLRAAFFNDASSIQGYFNSIGAQFSSLFSPGMPVFQIPGLPTMPAPLVPPMPSLPSPPGFGIRDTVATQPIPPDQAQFR